VKARWLAGAALWLVAACSATAPHRGDDYHPPHEHGEIVVPQPVALECNGALEQGGSALCKTTPGAEVRVNGETIGHADDDGWITVNFNREAPPEVRIEAHRDGVSTFVDLRIDRR
jgi:hypothetical protein